MTLFLNKKDAVPFEAIRSRYNPQQSALIDCHVTLCREDEIVSLYKVLRNLDNLQQKPIAINFGNAIRFENGKGVLIPATGSNDQFQILREQILAGLENNPQQYEPHITLIHPRNATCTDTIFQTIVNASLPHDLIFKTISLIGQTDGGKWKILKTFDLSEKNSN